MRKRMVRTGRGAAWLPLLLLGLLWGGAVARADLEVNKRKDTVVLKDGSKLECIVLMIGPRGVLVVVKDPKEKDAKPRQQLIPAERVARVIRGADRGEIKGFQTEGEQARKVVQGSGYRKPRKPSGSKKGPLIPTGKIEPVDPVLPAPPQSTPARAAANSKLSPKQLTEAYLSRFPALRQAGALFLGGPQRITPLIKKALEGDPRLRPQVEHFLALFLPGASAPRAASKAPDRAPPARSRKTRRPARSP